MVRVLEILKNDKVKVVLKEGVFKRVYIRKVRYFGDKAFVIINDREYFLK